MRVYYEGRVKFGRDSTCIAYVSGYAICDMGDEYFLHKAIRAFQNKCSVKHNVTFWGLKHTFITVPEAGHDFIGIPSYYDTMPLTLGFTGDTFVPNVEGYGKGRRVHDTVTVEIGIPGATKSGKLCSERRRMEVNFE